MMNNSDQPVSQGQPHKRGFAGFRYLHDIPDIANPGPHRLARKADRAIPEVSKMLLRLSPSVDELLKSPAVPVRDRPSAFIDAAGQVYEKVSDTLVPREPEVDAESGHVFYRLESDPENVVWAMREMYRSFISQHVPSGYRVEPIDGNKANCRLDNLKLFRWLTF